MHGKRGVRYDINNEYFELGAESLNARLSACGLPRYSFINFDNKYLLNLLPSNLNFSAKERNVIILSCRDLMPLALYYIKNDERFNVVFDATISVESMIECLKTIKPDEILIRIKELNLACLTKDEVTTLDSYVYHQENNFKSVRYDDIRKHYRVTKNIASKLNKRKFSHLFNCIS